MAFATASSPASRKPGDNAQTATPPQAQARPRQSPGNAEPPTRARTPSMRRAPPARARPPSAPDPPARQNPRRAPEPASACQSPQHAPEPPSAHQAPSACRNPRRVPGPQRAPGRKPGSGASTEPTIGLRDVNRAEQRVPRAVAEPSSEFPLRRIVNFVQLRSKLTILRSLKAKTHDYLRYRKAHTRTTVKNVRFSLPRPRKTGCFDHQRPKPTVFRIARPARQPNPMLNKQHSRHRSR